MTQLTELHRIVRSEDEPGALQPKTVERLFMTVLGALSAGWFALLAWCAYQIGVLAFS
jgi:hypothetical protein